MALRLVFKLCRHFCCFCKCFGKFALRLSAQIIISLILHNLIGVSAQPDFIYFLLKSIAPHTDCCIRRSCVPAPSSWRTGPRYRRGRSRRLSPYCIASHTDAPVRACSTRWVKQLFKDCRLLSADSCLLPAAFNSVFVPRRRALGT